MNFKEMFQNWIFWVGIILLTGGIFTVANILSSPAQVLERVTNPDHIISSYEEFEEIHGTILSICSKINNLENSELTQSGGFSKAELKLQHENNLSRWVSEYNAKSKMITRNNWKSSSLPHQIQQNKICN